MKSALLGFFGLGVLAGAAGAQSGIKNPGFEEAGADVPPGWFMPTPSSQGGYRALVDRAAPFEGGACARLEYTGADAPKAFGNLMQVVEAGPWRDRPIRLRARVRLESEDPAARAQLWLRVDRASGAMGLFDNMGDRPIRSAEWTECLIEGSVDPDAESLNVGVMLLGRGRLWIDAVELEATGAAVPSTPPEAPRTLDERGLANLAAFARLFGYVRHFYPGDEVEGLAWDDVALAGVRAVEGARDAAELAAGLQAFFAPIAPAVQVFASGAEPAPAVEQAPDAERVHARWWRHHGFGQRTGGYQIYRSEREKTRVRGELPAHVPDPRAPWSAELGAGIECRVPLALWADEQGTLPRAPEAAAAAASRFGLPPNHRASGEDRTTRLAAVIVAWNVLQHFYPYFDVVETDWPLELDAALRRAASDAGERAFLDTLRRLVAALHDGHGHVNHASDNAYAVLPLDWDWIEGRLVITRVGEAARAAGVAPGDAVVALDGRPVEELRAEQAALISGATPQWIESRLRNELLRGGARTRRLTLTAFARGDERYEVELALGAPLDPADGLPDALAELWPGTWYIDLGRVSDADFQATLPQLAAAEGLVFDLRGYPNHIAPTTFFPHLIAEPVKSAQWHVPEVTRPDREALSFTRSGEWLLEPREPFFTARRAFLTGGGAISYAESCLGIVEHYHLAEIVGGATAGTNGNINPFQVPGGYGITWTGMKVLKQDGAQHHGVGILPTIPVARTRAGVAEGRDEVLERAVEAVRNQ